MYKFIFPTLNLKIEKWKYNKEFQMYVSTLGHFKDRQKKNIPIKIASNGYCMLETIYGLKAAHRLVMLTWHPIPNAENLTVDHINHDKRCNELSNLEWVTQEENLKRAEKDFVIVPTIDLSTYNGVIHAGKTVLQNMEAAIDFVIKLQKIENPKKETIRKNIMKAIKNNSLYCKRRWKIVM